MSDEINLERDFNIFQWKEFATTDYKKIWNYAYQMRAALIQSNALIKHSVQTELDSPGRLIPNKIHQIEINEQLIEEVTKVLNEAMGIDT